ncbi:hypothetical protein B0H14DRAFT_2158842, partial [Mycena olivaceomarginata]
LTIKDLPPQLVPKKKLGANEIVACFICGTGIKLSMMRNHVGHHILFAFYQLPDPKATKMEVGTDPCGWCGRKGCYTQLTASSKGVKFLSNCDYHYAKMNYKSATTSTAATPCTNVPIHCVLCDKSISGPRQTIWKYNAMFHLFSEHSPG